MSNRSWFHGGTGPFHNKATVLAKLLVCSDSFWKAVPEQIASKTPRGPNPIHSHTKLRPPICYYRGWDSWMASLTPWAWVWASSGSWWWTEKPGELQSMGSQRVGHGWATELICYYFLPLPLTWKSTVNIHWKDWCWSYSSSTLATWCEELTHWKRPWRCESVKSPLTLQSRGSQRIGTLSNAQQQLTWKLHKGRGHEAFRTV